jgi:hypothetical protein
MFKYNILIGAIKKIKILFRMKSMFKFLLNIFANIK